jgi:hypothetical protein
MASRPIFRELVVEPTAEAALPQQQQMTLTVPLEWTQGQQLCVKLRGGRSFSVAVPPGAQPGSVVQVSVGDGENDSISITLPRDVEAGQHLAARAPDGRTVLFRAPAQASPGQSLSIRLPAKNSAASSSCSSGGSTTGRRILGVRVPPDWQPGQRIGATLPSGERLTVDAPTGTQAGALLHVAVPSTSRAADGGRPVALRFRVPEGQAPGTWVTVAGPDGQRHRCRLPDDAVPGADIVVTVTEPPRAEGGTSSGTPAVGPTPLAVASGGGGGGTTGASHRGGIATGGGSTQCAGVGAMTATQQLISHGGGGPASSSAGGAGGAGGGEATVEEFDTLLPDKGGGRGARVNTAEHLMHAMQLSHDQAASLAGEALLDANWSSSEQRASDDMALGFMLEDLGQPLLSPGS